MGLDLTLCPIYKYHSCKQRWLGYTRLALDRDYELFSLIDKIGRIEIAPVITVYPLPPDIEFWWYDDDGLEARSNNQYGTPLTYAKAGDFLNINANTSVWNQAVLRMIQSLPKDTSILLWWH